MNEYVVCVASNTPGWQPIIEGFRERILTGIDSLARFSDIYLTLSTTDGTTPYHNMVGLVRADMAYEVFCQLMKQWEKEFGRLSGSKIVPLDIDIVIFNSQVVRPRDYTQQYFLRGYNSLDHPRSLSEM